MGYRSAQDPGWPRTITKPGGKLVLYQPQVDDWKNYQQVDGRMAFTVTPTGGQSHVGVVTVQMKSAVNMDDHTVLPERPEDYQHLLPVARSARPRPRWTS